MTFETFRNLVPSSCGLTSHQILSYYLHSHFYSILCTLQLCACPYRVHKIPLCKCHWFVVFWLSESWSALAYSASIVKMCNVFGEKFYFTSCFSYWLVVFSCQVNSVREICLLLSFVFSWYLGQWHSDNRSSMHICWIIQKQHPLTQLEGWLKLTSFFKVIFYFHVHTLSYCVGEFDIMNSLVTYWKVTGLGQNWTDIDTMTEGH